MEQVYGYYLNSLESGGNVYGYDLYKIIHTKKHNIKYKKIKFIPFKERKNYTTYRGKKVFENEKDFIKDIEVNYKIRLK